MLEPRVYVIDDEEAVRDSMALLLEAREFTVQIFASGAEFLAVAASLPPGCVVTDMRMPGMDGQGCSTLSTEAPHEQRIKSGKSGSVSILTEG
jgi:FixJ family two-component response regulator